MATKNYKECDICYAKDLDGVKISNICLNTGHTECYVYDICVQCMADICKTILTDVKLGTENIYTINQRITRIINRENNTLV